MRKRNWKKNIPYFLAGMAFYFVVKFILGYIGWLTSWGDLLNLRPDPVWVPFWGAVLGGFITLLGVIVTINYYKTKDAKPLLTSIVSAIRYIGPWQQSPDDIASRVQGSSDLSLIGIFEYYGNREVYLAQFKDTSEYTDLHYVEVAVKLTNDGNDTARIQTENLILSEALNPQEIVNSQKLDAFYEHNIEIPIPSKTTKIITLLIARKYPVKSTDFRLQLTYLNDYGKKSVTYTYFTLLIDKPKDERSGTYLKVKNCWNYLKPK